MPLLRGMMDGLLPRDTPGKLFSTPWTLRFTALVEKGVRSGKMLIPGTSLTPLRANYMQASGVPYGELKL